MIFTKNNKKIILACLLVLFFLVGGLFRIINLDKVPPELFGDEIDVGLQAYSVLTTGKDYLGNKLPIMFHSFSEYRLPMQLYLAVPFIKLFGLNEYGVRGPSVFMGVLSLILIYFLGKEIFNKKLAIIATFFLMISPWHFNFSRQGNDAGILLPFVLAGVLFFLKGLKNYKYLFLSITSFALSIYTYAIASLFVPFFGLTLVFIFRKELFKINLIKLLLVGIVGLMILLPYLNFTINGISTQRFSSISSISEDRVMAEFVSKRQWSNSFLTRILYNKYTVATEIVFKNYAKSISYNFLFTEGDPNMRQGIEGFGQLYHFDVVLVYLGLIFAFWGKKSPRETKYSLLVLFWLLFAPIPSALTKDGGYHASRLILMLPPLILLSSLGFWILIKSASKIRMRFLFIILVFFMLFDITRFFHRYFVIWPNDSWRFWQTGFKETLSYVKSQDSRYERIFLNSIYEPMLPRFLFWYGYDMNLFQKQFTKDVLVENTYPGFYGFTLGEKYYFGEILKPVEQLAKEGNLIVASGDKDITNPAIFESEQIKLHDVIYSPTKIPIFYIYSANN